MGHTCNGPPPKKKNTHHQTIGHLGAHRDVLHSAGGSVANLFKNNEDPSVYAHWIHLMGNFLWLPTSLKFSWPSLGTEPLACPVEVLESGGSAGTIPPLLAEIICKLYCLDRSLLYGFSF